MLHLTCRPRQVQTQSEDSTLLGSYNGVQEGYQVTASVRSESKAQDVLDLHPSWKGKVTFVQVADITADGAFDDFFRQDKDGLDYIIHTASPMSFSVSDIQKDLIDPAVQG